MRIMPINNLPKTSQKKCSSAEYPKNNISFQGLGTAYALISLAAKGGIAAIKSNQKINFIRALSDRIYYPDSFRSEIVEAYSALAKTPDVFYSAKNEKLYLFDNLFHETDPTPTIPKLRDRGLKLLDYSIIDNSHYAVQTKKEFIKSLFDNGHEITTELAYQFMTLKDELYKSFKEEIIDTCLYSHNYNSIRHNPEYGTSVAYHYDHNLFSDYEHYRSKENRHCEQLFNNMMLISTLDKSKYNVYIERNRNIIKQIKQKLEQFLNREGNFMIKDVYKERFKSI